MRNFKCLSIIAPVFLMYFSYPQQQDNTEIYEQIKNAYVQSSTNVLGNLSFLRTWSFANQQASLSDNTATGQDLSEFWSGSTQFKANRVTDIELAQIIIDILMAYPQDHDRIKSFEYLTDKLIKAAVFNVTRLDTSSYNRPGTLDYQIHQFIRNIIQRNFQFNSREEYKTIYELYHNLYSLKERSISCRSYWEGPSSFGYKEAETVLLDSNSRAIPEELQSIINNKKVPDCQRAICTTRHNEPYNGFYNISDDASALSDRINRLRCNSIFTGSNYASQKKGLCLTAKQKNHLSSAPIAPKGGVLSLRDGKNYIESIAPEVLESLQPLQALLALQVADLVDAEITRNPANQNFRSATFGSILSDKPQKQIPLPSCSKEVPDGEKVVECQPLSTPSASSALEVYVNSLLGLSNDVAIIFPGLGIGLSTDKYVPNYDNTFALLVAGTYVEMTAQTSSAQGGKVLYWGDLPRAGVSERRLYLPVEAKDRITKFREKVETEFNHARNQKRQRILQKLILKSSSSDIVRQIYDQNRHQFFYRSDDGNVFGKTMLQTLKESSTWRLSDNKWLSSIASMSNISLLREIVVLLAEIKHLQYLDFLVIQTGNVLSASQASSKPLKTHPLFVDMLSSKLLQYLSGISDTEGIEGLAATKEPTEEEKESVVNDSRKQLEEAKAAGSRPGG